MKTTTIAILVAILAGAATIAGALSDPTCCACLVGEKAQTNQVINGTAANALFCAAAPGGNTTMLAERCDAVTNSTGGGTLFCTDFWSNASCASELAQAGVLCPSAGVPAATPLNLATLAVVLGAAGVAVLRRRRRDG